MLKSISNKALRLLQNISSLGQLNRMLLPLNEEFKKENPYEYFAIRDYYPHLYEESINLLIELSVLLRRESESYDKYKMSINSKVKYSNVAKYIDGKKDISFSDVLSKIIHASKIDFQMKTKNGYIGYVYEIDRNSEFTGYALITGTEKEGTEYHALVDVKKLCINAFIVDAQEYVMI